MSLGIQRKFRKAWTVTFLAAKRFLRIDGTHWAGSFAFNAFFSLFPLISLFVTFAAFFVDREIAKRAIITYVEGYVPLDGQMRARIVGSIAGVIQARERAGIVAVIILIWTALQCFTTLVRATNRAWGDEAYNWWRLPLKGMALLGVTAGDVLLGMAAPVLAHVVTSLVFPANKFGSWFYALWGFVVPLLMLFLGLTLFYRLAPRRTTRFAEVWVAAACATALLQTTESLFVLYLKHFAALNAVYGVFGGIMALLLWIYLSGCGFIFGACLCAALAEESASPAESAIKLEGSEI
ncbi:MAG: YihY/virulence factor BrkB family protein [Fibrobacteria bacterium]